MAKKSIVFSYACDSDFSGNLGRCCGGCLGVLLTRFANGFDRSTNLRDHNETHVKENSLHYHIVSHQIAYEFLNVPN